ncbi:hypothetical protein ACQKP3_00220 [Vibrio sp. DNB22_10_4]
MTKHEAFQWPDFDEANLSHCTLKDFFASDIQYSALIGKEILQGIRDYLSGERDSYDGGGNGYEFWCAQEGFYLQGIYSGGDEAEVCVSYPVVFAGLEAWLVWIEQG